MLHTNSSKRPTPIFFFAETQKTGNKVAFYHAKFYPFSHFIF